MEIRAATAADDEPFWRCLDAVARERKYLAMLEAPPLEEARAYLEQARAQGMIQLVAVDDGQVIGWCDISPVRWEGMRHCGRLGMGVLAAWRGRGIGTRLLVDTIDAAQRAGLTRIELDVFRTNQGAVRLYERHGFAHEGVKRQARVVDGMADDLLCMARLL